MRRSVILISFMLVVAACGGDGSAGESTTTTSVSSTVAGSTTLPGSSSTPTSTSAVATTTSAPVSALGVELLVAGPDGIRLIRADGSTDLIISGAATFAIDDLDGGVLYQKERWLRERRSVVYRVRAGSDDVVETLVPNSEQGLTLNGIARDGETFVYYTRDEGTTIDDSRQTLRRYSLESRDVTELMQTGGWEAGSFPISVGDGLIVLNWAAEALHGMDFIDLRANTAAVAADPTPSDGFEDCGACPNLAALSADGSRLVYTESAVGLNYAVIKHVASGAEIRRINLDNVGADWRAFSFDLRGDHLVVNVLDIGSGEISQALLYDLSRVDPEPIRLDFVGEAYLSRSPVTIEGSIAGP